MPVAANDKKYKIYEYCLQKSLQVFLAISFPDGLAH